MSLQNLAGVAFAATVAFGAVKAEAASVFEAVKQRGSLNCGTDNTAPGFGYLNTKTGRLEGLDVDFCRAVAAAILGDPEKVKFVTVTDKSRFNAVQTNQVDVVFAHTTVKPVRESAIGIDFLPINFYDGTGALVKAAANIKSFSELDGAAICTTQGSGTETTLSAYVRSRNWKTTKVLTFENQEKVFAALESGRCDAMVTDRSALASWRSNAAKPADYVVLKDVLAKSPFAGFVAANDSKWRSVLRWVTYALFQAEEFKITSTNLDEHLKTADPFEQKFLGVKGGFGKDFGLPDDFLVTTIKAVGNYGEIYERNLGPKTPYALDRAGTPNAPWYEGGLMYSPPWN